MGENREFEALGAEETRILLSWALKSDLILRLPFLISPYYPNSSIILYHLSRMISWGGGRLSEYRGRICELAGRCTRRLNWERLYQAAIGRMLGDEELYSRFNPVEEGVVCIAPLFSGHLLGLSRIPGAFNLSRRGWLTGWFESRAWSAALEYWLMMGSDVE